MDKDSLFMVSNNSSYTTRVLIHSNWDVTYWRSVVVSNERRERGSPPQAWETANFLPQTLVKSGILKEPAFDLNKVKGHVNLTRSITHFWSNRM